MIITNNLSESENGFIGGVQQIYNDNQLDDKSTLKTMKKIKAKKRTLEEFKNWLEGLQEFQPDNWVPSSDQWEHIKASIAAIKEPTIPKSTHSSNSIQEAVVPNVQPPQYIQPVQSSLDLIPTPSIASVAPKPIDLGTQPNINRDIDTSDGNYTSDFE